MQNLNCHEYYMKLAERVKFPTKAFIDGHHQASISGKSFESVNPATGAVLASISSCDASDLEATVSAARRVFNQGDWSRCHPAKRKSIMLKWVGLIEQHQEQLALLESLDSGKPISDCVTIDLPETIQCLSWYAESIDKIYDQTSPSGPEQLGIISKEPIGVVAAVLPWNFPLMMMAWKVGPALAAGNSVIVKPAEQTSITALFLASLAHQAGIPAGVLNVVPGFGDIVGKAIGLHDDIDAVSFTGSTEVGRLFLEYSARSNLKEIILECGGKSPSVVLSDAENIEQIAQQVLHAAFWNMGENCTANSRLIVHHSLKQQLTEKILENICEWTVGSPLNPNNKLGAMISTEHFDKVMTHIAKAQNEGARCIHGGEAILREKGLFILPTVFDNVDNAMRFAQQEIFGPVLGIISVSSDEQAIALANETVYGLQASVYSSNVKRALNCAKRLQAGTVSINCYSEGDITTPFGGYKQSGFGGRDNALHAFEQYTQTKTIWVDLAQ